MRENFKQYEMARELAHRNMVIKSSNIRILVRIIHRFVLMIHCRIPYNTIKSWEYTSRRVVSKTIKITIQVWVIKDISQHLQFCFYKYAEHMYIKMFQLFLFFEVDLDKKAKGFRGVFLIWSFWNNKKGCLKIQLLFCPM